MSTVSTACPYCRCGFEPHDGVMICSACGTPHHKDCFTENRGCTVFGCGNAPGDEPKIRILVEDLGEHVHSSQYQNAAAARTLASPPRWQGDAYPAKAFREEPFEITPQFGVLMERAYPAAPGLPWGLVLVFSIMSSGLFLTIWEWVLARWMRDVQPQSRAIYYYSVLLVLQLVSFACVVGGQINENKASNGSLLGIAMGVLLVAGRFSIRRSLEDYFDQAGAMGLCLSEVMTFFFGSIYFQYHLNRISKHKEERAQAIA